MPEHPLEKSISIQPVELAIDLSVAGPPADFDLRWRLVQNPDIQHVGLNQVDPYKLHVSLTPGAPLRRVGDALSKALTRRDPDFMAGRVSYSFASSCDDLSLHIPALHPR